jgi:Family of unknown function (DUF6527)
MKARVDGTPADQRLLFMCPGCRSLHAPRIAGVNPWTWNGDLERPTLSPSVLVTWPVMRESKEQDEQRRCHSFVNDGRISFLGDCTHDLAGQTVDLPELAEQEESNG